MRRKKLKENKWEGRERRVEVGERNRVENCGKNKEGRREG